MTPLPDGAQPHPPAAGRPGARIKAIETRYAGCLFRSRLEARWAAMFDQLGWHWTYEPIDTGQYIPDFLIHGDWPMLVEIKPVATHSEYAATADEVENRLGTAWRGDAVVLGVDPVPHLTTNWDSPSAGYLGEHIQWADNDTSPSAPYRDWNLGIWTICGKCGAFAIHHYIQSYACRPCGHWDGDHYLSGIERQALTSRWNAAHTRTRWVPRSA